MVGVRPHHQGKKPVDTGGAICLVDRVSDMIQQLDGMENGGEYDIIRKRLIKSLKQWQELNKISTEQSSNMKGRASLPIVSNQYVMHCHCIL